MHKILYNNNSNNKKKIIIIIGRVKERHNIICLQKYRGADPIADPDSYTEWPKKTAQMAITLSIFNGFSKFFHCWKAK